jgi:O-antigen ligase
VTITTSAQYTVIGYGGSIGGTGWLSLVGIGAGLLLWMRRRNAGRFLRSGRALAIMTLMLGAAAVGMSGCSGKTPAKNPVFTAPGTYTYTISATDGFLVHSATYTLTVTSQ